MQAIYLFFRWSRQLSLQTSGKINNTDTWAKFVDNGYEEAEKGLVDGGGVLSIMVLKRQRGVWLMVGVFFP